VCWLAGWLAVTIDGVQKTRPKLIAYYNASSLTQSQRGSHGASRAGPKDERVEGKVKEIGKDLEDISLIISCRYYGMWERRMNEWPPSS